jgi:hypothetical protein
MNSRIKTRIPRTAAWLVGIALSLGIVLLSPAMSNAQTPPQAGKGGAALTKAAAANKYLFLFFYKEGGALPAKLLGKDTTANTNAMRTVFESAMAQVADRADHVEVNIADASERDIVKQFDVSRAPMPLVLAIAPNGAVTGGFPGKFDEAKLVNAFATPGLAKCLKALQDRKLVLLCIQNEKSKNGDAAMRGVKDFKADPRYGQATEVVTVDPSNKEEAKLLADFKVPPEPAEAVTVFLAPPGSALATYTGATDKNTLVAKLTSAMASCGSGCGPSGCGPAKQ